VGAISGTIPNPCESEKLVQEGLCICRRPYSSANSKAMKGDSRIIDALNELLTAELTAINQYFIHAKMLKNWGYQRLAENKRKESIEEMRHADEVIERILYLDGTPNMQRLNPVRVGEDPVEMHNLDLSLEMEAVARLNSSIALATAVGDGGTRHLFEKILKEEEEAVDFLETQLGLIKDLGKEHYLAQMIGELS
jgi:bacterioferritin